MKNFLGKNKIFPGDKLTSFGKHFKIWNFELMVTFRLQIWEFWKIAYLSWEPLLVQLENKSNSGSLRLEKDTSDICAMVELFRLNMEIASPQ